MDEKGVQVFSNRVVLLVVSSALMFFIANVLVH